MSYILNITQHRPDPAQRAESVADAHGDASTLLAGPADVLFGRSAEIADLAAEWHALAAKRFAEAEVNRFDHARIAAVKSGHADIAALAQEAVNRRKS